MDTLWDDEIKSRQFIEALDKRGIKLTGCSYSDTRVEWDISLQRGGENFVGFVSSYEIDIKPAGYVTTENYPYYVMRWGTVSIDVPFNPAVIVDRIVLILNGRRHLCQRLNNE